MPTVQTYRTGRDYGRPQILEFMQVGKDYDADLEFYTFTYWMRDEARGLAYELEFIRFDDRAPSGPEILERYDNQPDKRILMSTEENQIKVSRETRNNGEAA